MSTVTAPARTARLLKGVVGGGALDLPAHRFVHGPLPLMGAELLELAAAVDLRGRGGAGFPWHRKARAVLAAGGRPVVVGNGSEGEPASAKDATLLTYAPHLVLDGLQLAASAVGAREIRLVVGHPAALRAVSHALSERAGEDRLDTKLRPAPASLVSGESSAAVRVSTGSGTLPAYTLQPTAAGGVDGRPTLVCNVETLAQLAVLARIGPDAYRRLGTEREPGTTLLTVHDSLGVRVVEASLGTPLTDVAPSIAENCAGVLVGGYHGAWLDASVAASLPVSRESRATLGAGVIVVLPASACPLAESEPVVRRLAAESAGQCGPCVFGLAAIAGAVTSLAEGTATEHDVASLQRWCGLVEKRGACGHPDGVARFVRSLFDAFPRHVEEHLAGGCRQPFQGLLPLGELA